jgi:hypothetical protein
VEAFSVIEESIMNADSKMQKESIRLLEESAPRITKEKYPLYQELIKVVAGG